MTERGWRVLAAVLWLAAAGPAAATHLQSAELLAATGQEDPATLPDEGWQHVDLPHVQRATEGTLWYRLPVPDEAPQTGTVLYLPRCHRCLSLRVFAGGVLVQDLGAAAERPDFNTPIWVPLGRYQGPLLLAVGQEAALGSAISSVYVGDGAALRWRFATRKALQQGLPGVSSAAFLALGLVGLVLGWRRRQESGYLLFATLSVLFWLRCLHYYATPGDWLPGWDLVGGHVTVASLGWMLVVAHAFVIRLADVPGRRAERLLVVSMLALTVALPLAAALPGPLLLVAARVVYPGYLLAALAATASATYAAWGRRSAATGWVVASLWANVVLGAHDWLLMTWRVSLEGVFLLPVGGVAMCSVFVAVLAQRYALALRTADRARDTLEARLAERERELRASFRTLEAVRAEQAVAVERQRLMREMHDGLGATLISTLLAVQRRQVGADAVAGMLQDGIDELRLAIDSLDPAGDDIGVLLGTLRYRLGPRLEAAGLALDWHVGNLPAVPWLTPPDGLHFLRFMQEVLANVLRHAGARRIRVGGEADATHITVSVADDGCGFDPGTRSLGRGLSHLEHRARALGAQMLLDSAPGRGTQVTLRIGLERRSRARALPAP